MINKWLKYVTLVIVCELLAIPAVMLVRHIEKPAYATTYKAYNSAQTIQKYIVTVKKISVSESYGGAQCVIWEGTPTEVDLASSSSLSAALNFSGNIKSGKWRILDVQFVGKPKIQGQVVMTTGTPGTYYTKAAHTGYNVGPAELEEIQPHSMAIMDGNCFVQTVFPYTFNGTGASDGIFLLMDLDYALTYYDGVGNDPTSTSSGTPKMFVNKPTSVVTIGAPAIKELYKFTNSVGPDSNLITMLYDAGGRLIGGNAAPLYEDDNGINAMLNGQSFTNQNDPYYADGVHALSIASDTLIDNGNGTYKLKLTFGGEKNVTGSDTTLIAFQKATHNGATWMKNNYTGGNFSTASSVVTGTYNCQKLQ